MRSRSLQAAVTVLVLASGTSARAQDGSSHHPSSYHGLHKEGTPPAGQPRLIPHTGERAGDPRALAGHLEPSKTSGGIGYYVGCGVLAIGRGEPRRRDEGTWGWDETGGQHFRRRIILGWSHGRKYQGGTGAYRTDGPVMPDLIYATTSTFNSLGRARD
jgi:hypothetical protein